MKVTFRQSFARDLKKVKTQAVLDRVRLFGSMKMKSAVRGKPTSDIEVTNVSSHGFWLFLDDRELFVAFEQFPWFREVSIRELVNVQHPHPHHLYWPDLDIDLAVESIEDPEKYPLVSRVRPNKRVQRTRGTRTPKRQTRAARPRPRR
jgi:predicted nucleotidyltransferase